MDTLRAVPPLPPLTTVTELAERWGISARAVNDWTESDREGFPAYQLAGKTKVWAISDIEAWETDRRRDGLPLPGERPRGPEPRGGR